MATNKIITVTQIPTRTGDTVASYNAYSNIDGLLGSLSVAEAAAGKTFSLSDANHNITVKTVWTTYGESTTNVSNIVVVDLSVTDWTISGASYDSVLFDVSAQSAQANGVYFKEDGSKMFITSNQDDNIDEWALGTPWLLSSATYTGSSSTLSGNTHTGLFFKPDGTKVYILAQTDLRIDEYPLSTPWDITSIGAVSSVSIPTNGTIDLYFNSDGTKVYFTSNASGIINEWTLSIAYDITSATASTTFDASAQDAGFYGISFQPDGKKMFITSETADTTVYEYDLGTAWLISSASYSGNSLSMAGQDTGMRGLFIKPDGSKLYGSGITANASVYQYSMG